MQRDEWRRAMAMVSAVLALVSVPAAAVEVSGGQSGTWTVQNSPYVVTRGVSVYAGDTLTIEPGVVVKVEVEGNHSVNVAGVLEAAGTAEAPIVFTSLLDDTGGDTNGDGSATEPAAGDWVGLTFSGDGTGQLDYCEMRYAGKLNNRAVLGRDRATPSLSHCLIADVAGHGLSVTGTSAPTLSHSTITRCTGDGIYLGSSSPSVSLVSSTITHATWPIRITERDTRLGEMVDNTFADNAFHGIRRDDAYVAAGDTVAWPDVSGLPYSVRGFTVYTGGILRLAAGQVVKLDVEGNHTVNVSGTLEAVGTASAPIVFTSLLDDTGGDTNGDGDATAPAAGDWVGLQFAQDGTGRLEHCQVRYAGKLNGRAVLGRDRATPTLSHCFITDVDGHGLSVTGTSAPTLSHSTITRCTGDGIYLGSSSPSVSLVSSTITHTTWPIRIAERDTRLGEMADNTFVDNAYHGIRRDDPYVAAGDTVTWPDVSGLPYSVRGFAVYTGGVLRLTAGQVVKLDVEANHIVAVSGALEAAGTASAPIVFTSLLDDTGGDTNGDGDATAPAAGDWVGLQFSQDGAGQLEYCQIRYTGKASARAMHGRDRATFSLSHCLIADVDGDGLYLTGTSAPSLSHSTITRCTGDAIQAHGTADIDIGSYNRLVDVGGLGLNNSGSGLVAADGNWWGAPSGPHHVDLNPLGEGSGVTDGVDFEPFLALDPAEDTPTAIAAAAGAAEPLVWALHQNAPNPFNPSTAIRFSLPRESAVRLTIHNLAGQVVTRLSEDHLRAGEHSLVWDASGLGSGVYLCRLEASGFVQVRKMLLAR